MTLFRLHFNGSLRITNFSHKDFHLCFSLLQMIIVLHPFGIRHNGDTGTDVQQGPSQRLLFRLRPCVNLFYCLLLLHSLRILNTTERDAGVIGISPRQTNARTWKFRVHYQVRCSAHYMLQRPNTLGSVRRREFGLICISSESCLWSKVGLARLPCFATLRSALSAKVPPGELLRLCPGSARRAPQ